MGFFRGALLTAAAWSSAVAEDEAAAASEVVQMTSKNAAEVLENEFVLVKFYAPWCGHCKGMAADYISAAETLKADGVVLAEVDATVEQDLASQHKVEGYPTLYWFVKGNKKDYTGPRTADGIVDWVRDNMGPLVKTVDAATLAESIEGRKWSQGLVVAEGDKKVLEEITTVATNTSMTNFLFVEAATPSLTLYKGTAEKVSFSGTFEAKDMDLWVKSERVPSFGQINEDNFELYVEKAGKGLFWVCLDPNTIDAQLKEVSPALVAAHAKQVAAGGETYPFVWLDVAEFEAHAREELGCANYPTIVLQRGDLMGEGEAKVEKFVRSFAEDPATLSVDSIGTFFEDVASGKLEPMPELDELDKLDDMDPEDELEDGEEGLDEEDIDEEKEEL